MKFLVIRISSLGDVILSTYLVRLLRKKFPDSRIDFLVGSEYQEVLALNKRIDKVLIYDKSKSFFWHLLQTFSINYPYHYDVIIDLQNNLRSKLFGAGKGSRYFFFNKRRIYKFKLVYFKTKIKEILPIPILYRDTFPDLQDFDDGLGLEIWTSKDVDEYMPYRKDLNLTKIERIALAPGAKHFTKRLPINKVNQLIELINSNFDAEIVLIGGKSDSWLNSILYKNGKNVQNFIGKLSILESSELLDSCQILISNDSAAVHIASARQVPVVEIFGSTVPHFGFVPFRVPYSIVELNNIECRPCTHFGKPKCPKKHFRCMEEIQPEQIIYAINELIDKLKK
ncbi:MAG: glycosyltransferase family 9 protein [Ignavibacteria bacterium]|nr:glycosyltransferase family 9 protein [Ignavibacteria bacterium]